MASTLCRVKQFPRHGSKDHCVSTESIDWNYDDQLWGRWAKKFYKYLWPVITMMSKIFISSQKCGKFFI